MKIAITQRILKNSSYFEIRESLDIRWGKLFSKLKFIPIVLPYGIDFKKYDFDGVILSGGNDIGEFDFRDKYETKLIEYCLQNSLPIFGVCRGMQLINSYFGGSLKRVDGEVGVFNRLIINQKSKYKEKLEKLKEVNSFHNFAIDRLGDGLIVSAWSEKNIIKAIEHKKYKIFACMWHSERNEPFDEDELKLIKDFFYENGNFSSWSWKEA